MAVDYLELAISASKSAGQRLLHHWGQRDELSISNKRFGDFVSNADLDAEKILRETLLGQTTGIGWLGEETDAINSFGARWIVDPLDGTTNFLRGIDKWAVSVALEVEGKLSLGVVHDPIRDETFSAELGSGAFLNGKPITVSKTSEMSSALFGTGIPFGESVNIEKHSQEIAKLVPHCAGVRRMGAAALDIAYVACGRFDGFWEHNLQLWDIAAGLVIAREAGATVSGMSPSELPEEKGDVVCANPILFDSFNRLISPH